MEDKTLNCPTVDVADDDNSIRRPSDRDLRLEILCLREQLKACEIIADRHAVMLREGDHRIKNSLQLVASLMRMQARREKSEPARDALRSAAERVSSIASIHDALQRTDGADRVDLGPVLQKMCVALRAMAGDIGHIEVRVDVEPLELPVLLAQPLALAVNELVVNALRHAFPDRDQGIVHVTLRRAGGDVKISIADDGVGLPADHIAGQGYGMTLVAMMIKQIGGELRTESVGGTRFTITAPLDDVAVVSGK